MAAFEPLSPGYLRPLFVAVRDRSIPVFLNGALLQSGQVGAILKNPSRPDHPEQV